MGEVDMSYSEIKLSLVRYGFSTAMNLTKIRVLGMLSKTCTPKVLSSIVGQNPFLIDRTFIRELSSDENANVQEAQELIEMFLQEDIDYWYWSKSNSQNKRQRRCIFRETPLHVATARLNSEDMYKTVKLLLTCGANVDVKFTGKTPLNALFYDKDIACKTLRFMLENGKNAIAALEHEINHFGLHIVMNDTEFPQRILDKLKLILEFGVEVIHERVIKRDMENLTNEFYVAKIMKLFMQYLVLRRLNEDQSKMNKCVSEKIYDKLFNMSIFCGSVFYEELVDYRKSLIKELIAMMNNKLDKNTTLFSFISERCLTSGTCNENEDVLVYKVLYELKSQRYICCDDLFHASIRPNAVLSKLHIFARKPSKEKIILNSDIVLYLSSYLTKSDIINLALTFFSENQTNLSGIRCFSTEARGHTEDHLSVTIDSVHYNPIFSRSKHMRI